MSKVFGIIPSRYDSSRFYGKPLALIAGKPMFWHVYSRACQCPQLSQVVLATDDQRIYDVAEELAVPVLMTRKDHSCGTERVLEAADLLGVPDDGVVLNIQGDEPALEAEMLSELSLPFADPEVQVTTLVRYISGDDALSYDLVKAVRARSGQALYFSRLPVPFARDGEKVNYLGHIGLYGFRMKTLRDFVALPKGKLEQVEKLEQLRLLENNIPIQIIITDHRSYGVDRPEDIATVEAVLSKSLVTR